MSPAHPEPRPAGLGPDDGRIAVRCFTTPGQRPATCHRPEEGTLRVIDPLGRIHLMPDRPDCVLVETFDAEAGRYRYEYRPHGRPEVDRYAMVVTYTYDPGRLMASPFDGTEKRDGEGAEQEGMESPEQ